MLRFWFEDTPSALRFAKDAAFDAIIRERFGALRARVLATDAAGWDATPDTLLAAVVVLDQFSRNLFRGRAEAFAGDALARHLTRMALRRGWDPGMRRLQRAFLYLPLERSELLADQDDSLRLYGDLGGQENVDYAIRHRDVIARFGRFPGRNKALGRASTAAEDAYLSQPGTGW